MQAVRRPLVLILLSSDVLTSAVALKRHQVHNSTKASSANLASSGDFGAQIEALLRKMGGSTQKVASESGAQEATGTAAGAVAPLAGGLAKPERKPGTSTYSLRTCEAIFLNPDDRDRCLRLQRVICPSGSCGRFFPADSDEADAAQCEHVKAVLCVAPIPGPTSRPTQVEQGSLSTITFCNAYPPSNSHKKDGDQIFIQHDKYVAGPDPAPFVTNLGYTECHQTAIPAGTRVNIFLGEILPDWVDHPNAPMASHVVGTDNAIVMLGQHHLGSQEMGIGLFSFEREPDHYRRPIICSAYPEPYVTVEVAGKSWHPFTDAEHPSALEYMTCKRLALDHADSVLTAETLDFSEGKVHTGEFEIKPTETLFIVGGQPFRHASYAFDNLQTRRKPKSLRGPYDRRWTDPAGRKISGTPA